MQDTWTKEYYITFSLVEGRHWNLVCQAEIYVTKPKALVFLQVDLISFECKCTELLDLFRLVDTVPKRACRAMVDIKGSQAEILLMPTSPIAFHLEIDLRRIDTEDVYS